jgi:hypothetical protein
MKFLRREMVSQKITFEDLSGSSEIPVSTLKKWFGNPDGTFNKVELVCHCLGYNLADLLVNMNRENVRTFSFSTKQQTYFKNHPLCFKIYWYLIYEKRSKDEVCELCQIQMKELEKNLLSLDRLDLITINEQGQYRLPAYRPIRWKFIGTFMKDLFQAWGGRLFQNASATLEKSEDSNLVLMQFFQLSEESKLEFLKDVASLEEKYARRTIRDLNFRRGDLVKLRFMLLVAPGSFLEREHSILNRE